MQWNCWLIMSIPLGVIWFINLSYLFRLYVDRKVVPSSYQQNNPIMKNSGNSKMSFGHIPMGMWTYRPAGRFGSFMSQYATLLSLSKLNGRQAFILSEMHDQLARVFKVRLPVIDREVTRRMKWKLHKLHNWMSPEYRNIIEDYVKLVGVVSSWTFYHHIRQEILEEFSFHDFIKDEVNGYLGSIAGSQKNVTYIGVHVRRGDNYAMLMLYERKGVVANRQYLQRAMGYFRNKYMNPIFVVTSNDMHWCRGNIDNFLGDVYFAGNGNEASPEQDFALLAHCNHTIMTMGSFGFWAAYLAGGETIYLTNFTLPDSPYFRKFRYETTYLPEWIGIPADLSPLLS